MMSLVPRKKVVFLDVETTIDMPSERVLNAALDKKLSEVIVIGIADGEYYFASSIASNEHCLWLSKKFEMMLLEA